MLTVYKRQLQSLLLEERDIPQTDVKFSIVIHPNSSAVRLIVLLHASCWWSAAGPGSPSLLNGDVKILATLLVTKLDTTMTDNMSVDQTGFIKV